MIWYALFTLPLAFVVWMALGIRTIQFVGLGAQVIREGRPRKAILLIDMQTGFLNSAAFDESEAALVRATIRETVASGKRDGRVIIAVQNLWSTPQGLVLSYLTAGGAGCPGRPGSELLQEVEQAADHVIVKGVQDSFASGELDRLLAELSIGELQIAGLDGLYCVQATTRAALQRGYQVSFVENGVLASNKEKWSSLSVKLQAHPGFLSPSSNKGFS